MKSENTTIILGPPGTGKTTRLLELVEQHLKQGVQWDKIAFVSFTKRAANEAKTRAMEKFKIAELPYFRTIHSLAFQEMKYEPRQVMSFLNYLDICKMLGISISSQKINDEGNMVIIQTIGDRLFFLENLARATKLPLQQVYQQFINDDLDFKELELLQTTLAEYKKTHNKIDYTDMIVEFNKRDTFQYLDILFVDEAQDLSPIQWDAVELMAKSSKHTYIAGDDDQAIYTWAGADVQKFLSLKGKTEVLHQSYRLPATIHQAADSIIKRIVKRNVKPYRPKMGIGKVERIDTFENLDMSKGTWLLLARNIFLLSDYSKHCIERGYLFYSRYGSPINADIGIAIRAWEDLRAGREVRVDLIKLVYSFMRTKKSVTFGFKELLEKVPDREYLNFQILKDKFGLVTQAVWHEALTKLTPVDKQYFIAAIKRGEQFGYDQRIKINTIHGVKGAEADNVVIATDMSQKTYDEFQRHPDDELRVWYVAITRSKQNLYILNPQTNYFVDI